MKAIWNGKVIAESNDTVVVEGNHYFPIESINKEYLKESPTHSICPWKGEASYYTLDIDDQTNEDAVWHYKDPSNLAKAVKDRVAFSKGVKVA